MKSLFLSTKTTWPRVLGLAAETVYLLIVFLIPVWFAYFFPGFNMFELSKLAVFRFLVWFLLALTAARTAVSWGRLEIPFLRLLKLFFLPALFIIGLAVSLFFSINPQQSFFGSYDRQEGWISQAMYFLWSLLLAVNLLWFASKEGPVVYQQKIKERIRRLVFTMVVSTSLVALYGVLQMMGIDFLDWPEQPYLTGRTLSFLGQPNFLASFLLLGLPLTGYFLFVSKKFFIKSAYFILLILQLACLFFTASRGGLLALMATVALLAVYLFFKTKLSQKVKIGLVITAIVLMVFGVAAMELVTPGRLKESFDLTRGSFASRVFFFQASADAILQRPLFGYGLENGSEVFIKYYERDWGIYGDVGSNTDRAHNIILDILISAGFFGLILLAALYYFYFRLNWQEIQNGHSRILAIALFLGAFAYLFSLLFSFPIAAAEIYFWSFLAIIIVLLISQSPHAENAKTSVCLAKIKRPWVWLAAILLIVLAGIQMSRNLQVLMADYFKNRIFIAVESRRFIEAAVFRAEIEKLKINPALREHYDYYLGAQLVNYCNYASFQDAVEEKIVKDKLRLILDALPDSGYENILFKANTFACFNQPLEAEKYFNILEELAPEWPRAYLERGRYAIKQGELAEAEKYYQLVDFNLPDPDSDKINIPHRRAVANYKALMYTSLAEGYFKEGNYVRAEIFFQAAFRYRPEDYSLFKRIADCYYLQGDLNSAIKYVRRGLAANPSDVSWYVALAVLYFENDNVSEALLLLDEAEKLPPTSIPSDIENLRLKFTQ